MTSLFTFSCTTNALPKKLPNVLLKENLINGRLGNVEIIDIRKDTSSIEYCGQTEPPWAEQSEPLCGFVN